MHNATMIDKERVLWQASLACFVLAAVTGLLYRLGMVGWLPGELGLENIRHAHSHLMFFGWAVPFPLVILLNRIRNAGSGSPPGYRWMKYSLVAGMIFGLLAYPFFLFYGYRPVPVGSATMPLSVILSGLVMISWYGFMAGYLRGRSALNNESTQPWFDGALVMLLVCSLGAWGVAVVQALDPDGHLFMKGLTHFFLATFTEGWVVLVLLAVLLTKLQPTDEMWLIPPHVALGCIAIGAPLTFPYGISESLLSAELLVVARLGGALAASGLSAVIYALWSSRRSRPGFGIWSWPVALLGIKAAMQLGSSVIPSSFWLSDHALRILYLHLLLLGAFTLAMSAWLQERGPILRIYYLLVAVSVMAVLVSLVFPTSLWPPAWSGSWIYYLLVAAAMLPPLAMGLQGIRISQLQKKPTS